MTSAGPRVRVALTADLEKDELCAIRGLLSEAFGNSFAGEDWEHCLGGWHVIADVDGLVVSHAAVVRRDLLVGDVAMSSGYVEGVATAPAHQGLGFGSAVMAVADELVLASFELGALSTSAHRFYERLGWKRWRGPSFVLRADGPERTPDEDDGLMVLLTPKLRDLDLTAALTCYERPGDDW